MVKYAVIATSGMVNRGDGVMINLHAPLRYRDEQMGIFGKKKKKGGKR